MDYSSRGYQLKDYPKDYSANVLRENYNSNNSSKFSSQSQIVDELRKKYDTPTRKDLKYSYDKTMNNYDIDTKKSLCEPAAGEAAKDRWPLRESNQNYEVSPGYRKENIAEEETIFRKIKEMKDSLLNKNDKIKTTKSIYEPKAHEKPELKDPRSRIPGLSDNRVENIDKINVKIQQILTCLKQTENKNPAVPVPISAPTPTTTASSSTIAPMPNAGLSTSDIESRLPLKQTQLVSRSYCYSRQADKEQKSMYTIQPRQSIQPKVEMRNTSSIYQEDRKYKLASPAPRTTENVELSNNRDRDRDRDRDRERSRVRSFISSIQRDKDAGGKYEMKNGKKLDDEISKIQSKIHQFEEEKRRLNIDFKPYSYSNSKSTADLSKRSYTIDKNQKPLSRFDLKTESIKKFDEPTPVQRPSVSGCEKYQEKTFDDRYSARISLETSMREREKRMEAARAKETKDPKDIETSIAVTTANITKKQVKEEQSLLKLKPVLIEPNSISSSRVEERSFNEEIRKRADEGIQDRKKRLASEQPKSRPTIKKLVDKLSEQTRLDEKFRNNKLHFESNNESQKWEKLGQIMIQKGVNLTGESIQKVFQITDEENNPFFSVRESQSSIEMLANSYLSSEEHWNQEILNKFSKDDLSKEDFTVKSLDLEKKGYVVVEDIVRFLNMETGTFYRNRDIFLIFRRMSEQDKVSFEDLMKTFCK